MLHFCILVLQQSPWPTLHYLSYEMDRRKMIGEMLFDKRGSNTEWKEGGWGWWCILWLFHVGGLEHVYDNRDEVTHKNTHICFWSLYLIELFSAFSFRLSHLLHKLLRFSCSSDLFLDLPGECGNLHHLSPLSTRNRGRSVSTTDFYKNIINISHHLTTQEVL